MNIMMSIADIEKINKVLGSMMQYELDLSDFYKQSADTWTEDQAFWQNLAYAETKHAENIQKMREIIAKKQERFELGRPFNPIALNTAMTGLKDYARRLTSGEFSFERILITARDIEESMLESHYAEIVKTADIEYQTLMKEILSDTYQHKKMIQKKIDDLKKKA
jgi:ferritin